MIIQVFKVSDLKLNIYKIYFWIVKKFRFGSGSKHIGSTTFDPNENPFMFQGFRFRMITPIYFKVPLSNYFKPFYILFQIWIHNWICFFSWCWIWIQHLDSMLDESRSMNTEPGPHPSWFHPRSGPFASLDLVLTEMNQWCIPPIKNHQIWRSTINHWDYLIKGPTRQK